MRTASFAQASKTSFNLCKKFKTGLPAWDSSGAGSFSLGAEQSQAHHIPWWPFELGMGHGWHKSPFPGQCEHYPEQSLNNEGI